MSDDFSLACPVCRARQAAQPLCRRCGADLALYVQALRSERQAQQLYDDACRSGNPQRIVEVQRYWQWLRPQGAAELPE